MSEAISTPSPSYISSNEKEKVRSYREKISKWQSQVSERLEALDSTKQVAEKKENNTKARVDAAAKENDVTLSKEDEKKKKLKRKRNQIKDLRFEQELAVFDGRSKRKERKKKYWEAKKQKKNQGKTVDTLRESFPKHEQIRFGDVVQAPPKLAVVPKPRKTPMSASKERLRLEAIDEAYRSRNGWTSRSGVQIPSAAMQ